MRWPKLIILLALLLTGFLGYETRHFRIDSSVENLYNQNDPNKQYYEKVRARFGSDDMGVIGVVAENVYTSGTLEKIRRITQEVEKIDGVGNVQSLTNVPDPIADLGNPPPLITRIPTDPTALAALRRKVADNPIYLNVVSRDGKGAAILIFFKDQVGDDEASEKRRDERLEEIIAREQGPEQLYLTGMQHITVNSLRLMRRDLRTFTPLSLAVIMVILGLCFRNVRGVVLPLMSVTCGVVWTLGIMMLTGEAITIGTLVLPTLLIVIGSTYSIYVIAQYEDEILKGGSAGGDCLAHTLPRHRSGHGRRANHGSRVRDVAGQPDCHDPRSRALCSDWLRLFDHRGANADARGADPLTCASPQNREERIQSFEWLACAGREFRPAVPRANHDRGCAAGNSLFMGDIAHSRRFQFHRVFPQVFTRAAGE